MDSAKSASEYVLKSAAVFDVNRIVCVCVPLRYRSMCSRRRRCFLVGFRDGVETVIVYGVFHLWYCRNAW